MKIKELGRDKATELYKAQGYLYIKGKILKGKELNDKLCSLFWSKFKQTLSEDNVQKLQVCYAEMMESVTTLMAKTKTQFKNHLADKNQQALQWYKGISPAKTRLKEARVDLMQKFYELTQLKTEAVRDQLNELLASLHNVITEHGLKFANVEKTRKIMQEKLGGYSKGIYLESVSRTKTNTTSYSA